MTEGIAKIKKKANIIIAVLPYAILSLLKGVCFCRGTGYFTEVLWRQNDMHRAKSRPINAGAIKLVLQCSSIS